MTRFHALALLSVGLAFAVAQAFVPLAEFIHRGDDAYYYFKIAANYPVTGFWTFDGLQPTNGVQPLWAWLLTACAQIAAWLGIIDPDALARGFVLVAALVQFAAALLLYRVVAAAVSVGTGFAAAGACLFPMSMLWGRLWGVESPLLALSLVAVVAYYHLVFRPAPSLGRAAVLGVLLGCCGLSRLNAGLLIPCLLSFHLLSRSAGRLSDRFRQVMMMGSIATLVVAPYFAWNLAHTGHLLPISGEVKSIGVARALDAWGGSRGPLWRRASFVYYNWPDVLRWFVTSRTLDGLWLTGVRLVHDGATHWRTLIALLAMLLLGPFALGRPREWWNFLLARTRRLTPFSYFLVYAILDAGLSIALYPTQSYAIPRWWLISSEIVLVVLGATVSVASIAYLGERLMAPASRLAVAMAASALLIVGHAVQTGTFYWDGRVALRDWNRSWNDESYRAAQWLNANVREGELVGSWNAGVVSYYSNQSIVNLDGLVNNRDLVPYLRDERIHEYILKRKLRYLSDLDPMFRGLAASLILTEVYGHHSPLMRSDYHIYRVDGARPVIAAAGAP